MASLLFGLGHLPSRFAFAWLASTRPPVAGFVLAVAAVLADQVVTGYRNAWVSIGAHTLYDCIAFLSLLGT